MLLFHQEVFDEIITGTGKTWYSSAEFNQAIGAGDMLRIFAVATDVIGTPSLQVYLDTSADNEHWVTPTTAKISRTLTQDPIASASAVISADALASFARLRITMTGSGPPKCRLQLSVTGRAI